MKMMNMMIDMIIMMNMNMNMNMKRRSPTPSLVKKWYTLCAQNYEFVSVMWHNMCFFVCFFFRKKTYLFYKSFEYLDEGSKEEVHILLWNF